MVVFYLVQSYTLIVRKYRFYDYGRILTLRLGSHCVVLHK
jgi:hypothetical protein